MEPFKNLLNAGLVRGAATHLRRAEPRFDADGFVRHATRGLDALEMKARAMQIADALERTLPEPFDAAAAVLEAALAPVEAPMEAPGDADAEAADTAAGLTLSEGATDRDKTVTTATSVLDAGLKGWILWPVGEFIARRGLHEPGRALQALHALTQRFTAEFAIRPFIAAHPNFVFATLERWTADPSAHVRRLVSEGSRPRLPWGLQLKALVADPSPTLPLLRALQDDASEYVRRSVANHLNDIAKDHPHLVAEWVERHLADAPPARRALLRHASRTLIKQGDARILAAWGQGARLRGEATLVVKPARIALGGAVTLTLTLRSTSTKPQALAIDYVVHHVKADGRTSPKVFKGWQLTLAPRETRTLVKRHAVRPITTRTYYAGKHRVVVQVNGQAAAEGVFQLRV